MVTKESNLPYDKPSLSKFQGGIKVLRDENFFRDAQIDVIRNSSASKLNSSSNEVKLDNGKTLSYTKLLIATGARAKYPEDLVGTQKTFRNIEDFEKFSVPKEIVFIGGGVMSLELASKYKKAGASTKIVSSKENPLQFLGKEVSGVIRKLVESNGVQFFPKAEIKSLKGGVQLVSGESITGEVVSCTGIEPNSEFLSDELVVEKDYVKVNSYMETSKDNVFAAGDVATYPAYPLFNRSKCGHWVTAQQQGTIAALNMLEKEVIYDYVPYYWASFFDKKIEVVGSPELFDEVVIEGKLEEYQFAAYYLKNNKVVGFACMGIMNGANVACEALRQGLFPNGLKLKSGEDNLDTIRNKVRESRPKCKKASCCRDKI